MSKKFQADAWDPRSESSKGHESEGMLVVAITTDAGRASCLCGCGDVPTGKKARFIPGHDARYKGMLNRAAIAGVKVVTVTDGKASKPATALTAAKRQGWEALVEASKSAYEERAKAKAQEAKAA